MLVTSTVSIDEVDILGAGGYRQISTGSDNGSSAAQTCGSTLIANLQRVQRMCVLCLL